MVDILNQMPGTPTTQELRLTTAMREAIERGRERKVGRRGLYIGLCAAVAVVGVVLLLTIGRTSRDSAVVVGGFIVIVCGIIGAATWQEGVAAPRRFASAIEGGNYTRYEGWFVVELPKSKGSRGYNLALTHSTLVVPFEDSSPFFKNEPNTDDPWWAAIDYVSGTDIILAIWHNEWKLLHHHPSYDPEKDTSWPRPDLDPPAKPSWHRPGWRK